MANSFNGVVFEMVIPLFGAVPQVPKWPDRHYPNAPRLGSVEFTILGRMAVQEVIQKWRPVTLTFDMNEKPAAYITQPMLNAFMAAWAGGGVHTLVLEHRDFADVVGGQPLVELAPKQVIFDHRFTPPVEVNEVSPTNVIGVPGDRLYNGTVHFLEILA